MLPKISIITPSYNQGKYLEETINSVLSQNYQNLEYIIIDGGSTDNSLEIIKKYESNLDYWISESDNGQSHAINKGFKIATGDILGWLNSDDLLFPDSLLNIGSYFSGNPDCNFVVGDASFVDIDKNILFNKYAFSYSFMDLLFYNKGNYLPQPSVFFSREALCEVGLLDESLHYTMDLELWLRLRNKYNLYTLSEILSLLRQHNQAKTIKYNEDAMLEAEKVIIKNIKDIKMFTKIILLISWKSFIARSSCITGLSKYFDGDLVAAKKAFYRACRKYPPIVLTKTAMKLYLRLYLPKLLKNYLFVNP